MDLTAMQTAVRTKTGLDANDSLITTAVLTALINEAVHKFEVEADWPWLEALETLSLTSGNTSKTPAATYLRTISVFESSTDRELKEAPIEFLDRLTSATGAPQFYGYFGGDIQFRPGANGSLNFRHRYIRFEPDLVAGGDTPLAKATWHPAIVEYACALVYRRLQDSTKAAQCLEAYKLWVDIAKRRSNLSSPDQGGGVAGDQ